VERFSNLKIVTGPVEDGFFLRKNPFGIDGFGEPEHRWKAKILQTPFEL